MNLETVFKCAEIAARSQETALGYVSQDIKDLIAELSAADEKAPEADSTPKSKKSKAAE